MQKYIIYIIGIRIRHNNDILGEICYETYEKVGNT